MHSAADYKFDVVGFPVWMSHESISLKGNSTDIIHQSLFTGVGEYVCVCEQSCIETSVSPEGNMSQCLLGLKTTGVKMEENLEVLR